MADAPARGRSTVFHSASLTLIRGCYTALTTLSALNRASSIDGSGQEDLELVQFIGRESAGVGGLIMAIFLRGIIMIEGLFDKPKEPPREQPSRPVRLTRHR